MFLLGFFCFCFFKGSFKVRERFIGKWSTNGYIISHSNGRRVRLMCLQYDLHTVSILVSPNPNSAEVYD